MREIKYRGLSKGKWVYGFYAHKPCGDIEQHFIIDWHINNAGCRPDTYFYDNPVIPETVGQYTGLKDKNGKEIFEGDVLYHKLQGKRVVYYPFNEHVASYGLREISSGFCSTLQDSHRVYELIGNIHENQTFWR